MFFPNRIFLRCSFLHYWHTNSLIQSAVAESVLQNLIISLFGRGDLTEDGLREHSGPWHDQVTSVCIKDSLAKFFFIMTQNFIFQGLCLVDWGRGIDKRLFPENAEFKGDCRTSGFRCIEMQENKPWTFQASLKSYIISNAVASVIDLTY